ncbi:DUF6364 family protein [Alteromonas sp. LMIT006]|jgi:replicative DNA helicase|uniref:DUF6364 family protein n=1 Tax=Alteromonadaceae TaxID=72275 RepID=UPI0020CA7FDA|nr:DUF6364 family protein [Alteromonas sp. LMIT006]UTP71881.1 DUF6364 family protein [Alteromonas sp. LMIT006]
MQSKLTLRLEERLIDSAKRYAQHNGVSLSHVVANYFAAIQSEEEKQELAPITRSLVGSSKKVKLTVDDYKKHLESKYL